MIFLGERKGWGGPRERGQKKILMSKLNGVEFQGAFLPGIWKGRRRESEESQYTCFHVWTLKWPERRDRTGKMREIAAAAASKWNDAGMETWIWSPGSWAGKKDFQEGYSIFQTGGEGGISCSSLELHRLEINKLTSCEGLSLCQHKAVGKTKPVLEHQKQHMKCGNYNRHYIRCQILQWMNQSSIWQLDATMVKLHWFDYKGIKNNLWSNFQCEPCFRKGHCSVFHHETTSLTLEPPSLQKC